MTRKKNRETLHVAKERLDEKPGIFSIMLISREWKNFLTENEFKVLVARALNHCVFEHELVITGYAITHEKVYLVIKIEKDLIKEMLTHFAEILKISLLKHFGAMKKKGVPFLPALDVYATGHSVEHLFEEYSFDDDLFVRLLTGEKIEWIFYNDGLVRLEKQLLKNNFCSLVDYSGASGPVKIELSGRKEKKSSL